jgi:hypothetical protein
MKNGVSQNHSIGVTILYEITTLYDQLYIMPLWKSTPNGAPHEVDCDITLRLWCLRLVSLRWSDLLLLSQPVLANCASGKAAAALAHEFVPNCSKGEWVNHSHYRWIDVAIELRPSARSIIDWRVAVNILSKKNHCITHANGFSGPRVASARHARRGRFIHFAMNMRVCQWHGVSLWSTCLGHLSGP